MQRNSTPDRRIRVGIVGVGNCASAFVQGLAYYSASDGNEPIPSVMSRDVGGYTIGDIDVSCAFDVSDAKVGRDVSEAIWAEPNNTARFAAPSRMLCTVERGPTLDGIGIYMTDAITESSASPVDVSRVLRDTRTDVLVSYLPVGSEKATRYYAEQALEARCAFVNCIPVFIASDAAWRTRFAERGVPIIGDDIKSQVGATIVHRTLARLFEDRGVRIDRSYQLNFGGNADFKNMLERDRLRSKKISKTQSVQSQLAEPLDADAIHIGPSDFVPWLTDRKTAYIRLEATAFGGMPLSAEVKLEVWDSPNSAGVVIDAVRCAKLALDRGIGGALTGPSSYLMKSPPRQYSDTEARVAMRNFIDGS